MFQLEASAGVGASCERHFISSVGVDTTHVARPPIAPARNVVTRLEPVVDVGFTVSSPDVEVGGNGKAWFSKASERLYETKSKALRAPYPRIGAAVPVENFRRRSKAVERDDKAGDAEADGDGLWLELLRLCCACSRTFKMSRGFPMIMPIAPEMYPAQKSADMVYMASVSLEELVLSWRYPLSSSDYNRRRLSPLHHHEALSVLMMLEKVL